MKSPSPDRKASQVATADGPPPEEIRDDGRPRILLADDDAAMRAYLRRLLKPLYEVHTVSDGEAALSAARAQRPDLVLSDVLMPRMDGFELLRQLRSDPATRGVPVILLSARGGEESRIEGLETGADDYLVKPFSAGELLARMRVVLMLARIRREATLREDALRRRLADILESMQDGFIAVDRDWRLTYVNAAAEKDNRVRRESVLGKTHWEAFPAVLGTEIERNLRRAMVERVAIRGESYYEPHGRWYQMDIHPVGDGGLAFYGRDVTARVEAEQAQRRLQRERDELLARLQLQFERMPIACVVTDPQIRIMDWNPAAEAMFGYRREEVIGKEGASLLVAPSSRADARDVARRLALGDMAAHAVHENVTKNGGRIICDWRNTPLRDADGKVIAVLAMAQDVTELVRAEKEEELFRKIIHSTMVALQQVTTRLNLALHGSDIGIFELELPNEHFEHGRIVFSNLWEQLGYDQPESPSDFAAAIEWAHPDDRKRQEEFFRSFLAAETPHLEYEHRLRHSDGSYRTMLVRGVAVRDPAGKPTRVIGSRVDITARKRVEQELRGSEERYRSLISQVKDYAIFSTDERGIVTSWNEGCQWVLGYSQDEFLGLDIEELFTPEDRAGGVPAAELHQAAETGTARYDRWMVAKGGRRFFAMGATTGLRRIDRRVVRRAGRESSGGLMIFNIVMQDMTQMKLSQDELAQHGESLERLATQRTNELEETTQRLRVSERMASLGTLAAGLGHDMGNLLLPIDVRLKLLLDADLPPQLREHVIGIHTCSRYLQQLSSGLRLLAVDPWGTRVPEVTELGAWRNDVNLILKDAMPSGVRFEHEMPPTACWVGIGRVGLTQAVFNLVQNAADALRERGTGRVRVSVDDRADAPWVVVWVTDDGPGMTDEVVHRCMEPYFSTKTRGVSTGMGLTVVHGLITRVGGRVDIESTIGVGTTISLVLPRGVPDGNERAAPRGARDEGPAHALVHPG